MGAQGLWEVNPILRQSCHLRNKLMTADYLIEQAVTLAYRWAGYALMNLADDAAMIAFVFC